MDNFSKYKRNKKKKFPQTRTNYLSVEEKCADIGKVVLTKKTVSGKKVIISKSIGTLCYA